MALFEKKKKVIEVDGKKIELEPKKKGIFSGLKFNIGKSQNVQLHQVGVSRPKPQQIPKIAVEKIEVQRQAPTPKRERVQTTTLPSGTKVKEPGRLRIYLSKQAAKHKGLETALIEQGIRSSVYEFVRRMFFAAVILTAVLTVALFILFALIVPLIQALLFTVLLGFAIYVVSFGTFLNYPQSRRKQTSKNIERDILFAARDMIISLRSGMPLYNTITAISTGYGDASREFAKIVERVQLGTPLEDSIDQTVAETKSPSFRRIMLQAAVSIRAGADVVGALQSVIDQLSEERVIELRRYGQRLNAIAMFYMLFGIILPSMGIAVVTILTTFIALFTITPVVLDFVMVGILFLQVIFLQLIRGSRPVFTM